MNVDVGGGYRANMKTGIESFSHKITNCQRYNNIIRGRQEESLFALQPLGALGGRGGICEQKIGNLRIKSSREGGIIGRLGHPSKVLV